MTTDGQYLEMVLPNELLEFYKHNPVEYPVVAVLETSGPNPLKDDLLGIYLAGQQDSHYYLDLSNGAGAQEIAVGFLRSFSVILFNAAKCLAWLSRLNVKPNVADPMLAAYVLDPNQPLALQSLARKYAPAASHPTLSEPLEAGILHRSPDELLPQPIGEVATFVAQLYQKVRDLPDWAEPIYEQELALANIVAGMELRGIRADESLLGGKVQQLEGQAAELDAKLDSMMRGSGPASAT